MYYRPTSRFCKQIFIYCLADAKSALIACSQLLVVTNNLNPADCLV